MADQLSKNPVHLGLGATAVVEPEFTGFEWYEAYSARHAEQVTLRPGEGLKVIAHAR